MFRRILLVAALIALVGSSGRAADPDGNFAVKGAGLETCETYLTARENQDSQFLLFRTWLNGFTTAYNMQTDATYDVAPMHSIDDLSAALTRVCENNPDQNVVNAVVGLVKGLRPARATRASDTVTVGSGDQAMAMPANLLARVQQRLKQRGYYDGPIDAKYGPGTAGALKAYQEEAGLEPSGLPTQTTVVRLMQPEG